MKTRILAILIALCLPTSSWAVGSCVVSDITSSQNTHSTVPDAGVVIITVVCTGDAATGSYPAVTIPLTGFYPASSLNNAYNLTGFTLYAVGRTPGATAPTANYTTTIKDYRGYALDNALMTTNGSATAAQMTWITSATAPYPVFPVVRQGPLTVQITANSVNSAVVTLDLIFRVWP